MKLHYWTYIKKLLGNLLKFHQTPWKRLWRNKELILQHFIECQYATYKWSVTKITWTQNNWTHVWAFTTMYNTISSFFKERGMLGDINRSLLGNTPILINRLATFVMISCHYHVSIITCETIRSVYKLAYLCMLSETRSYKQA